jgi:hypothetical protein
MLAVRQNRARREPGSQVTEAGIAAGRPDTEGECGMTVILRPRPTADRLRNGILTLIDYQTHRIDTTRHASNFDYSVHIFMSEPFGSRR